MYSVITLLLLVCLCQDHSSYSCSAFSTPSISLKSSTGTLNCKIRKSSTSRTTTTTTTTNDNIRLFVSNDEKNSDSSSSQNNNSKIPQLPAAGAFGPSSLPSSSAPAKQSSSSRAVVDRKMELQYTCNICETRNCHRVSRMAYNKGVVIVTCKGCGSRHLIADHLGFTEQVDGNIEDFLPQMSTSTSNTEVNRVNDEVFQLEKTLNIDTSSGSLISDTTDDNGNPNLFME